MASASTAAFDPIEVLPKDYSKGACYIGPWEETYDELQRNWDPEDTRLDTEVECNSDIFQAGHLKEDGKASDDNRFTEDEAKARRIVSASVTSDERGHITGVELTAGPRSYQGGGTTQMVAFRNMRIDGKFASHIRINDWRRVIFQWRFYDIKKSCHYDTSMPLNSIYKNIRDQLRDKHEI